MESTTDLPQQLSPISDQDALMCLIAVLANSESANVDSSSDIVISRSDFLLLRSLADFCLRQARIRRAMDQLIHDKDQQLQRTRHQLDTCFSTVMKLSRRLKMWDDRDHSVTESEITTAVVGNAPASTDAATTRLIQEDLFTEKTLPMSVDTTSNRIPLQRTDLEVDTLRSDGTTQVPDYRSNRKHTAKQSENLKPEFAKDSGGGGASEVVEDATPEAGAPCHVTVAQEYLDKVVQQNVRLKRLFRDLVTQRHGSVAAFLTVGEYDDVIAQLRHSVQVLSSRVQQYRSLLAVRCSGDVNTLANKCAQLTDKVAALERSVVVKQALLNAFYHHHHHHHQLLQSSLDDATVNAGARDVTEDDVTSYRIIRPPPSSVAHSTQQTPYPDIPPSKPKKPEPGIGAAGSRNAVVVPLLCARCEREFDDEKTYAAHCAKCRDD